jgi:hypothetical protein
MLIFVDKLTGDVSVVAGDDVAGDDVAAVAVAVAALAATGSSDNAATASVPRTAIVPRRRRRLEDRIMRAPVQI